MDHVVPPCDLSIAAHTATGLRFADRAGRVRVRLSITTMNHLEAWYGRDCSSTLAGLLPREPALGYRTGHGAGERTAGPERPALRRQPRDRFSGPQDQLPGAGPTGQPGRCRPAAAGRRA